MSQFAKQALMAKHAYVAALLAGAAAIAGAQPMGAGGPMGGGMNGPMGGKDATEHGMHGAHMGHGRMDPDKMQAMMAKRQADLKAKLKLSPEQEASWTSYTAAMKPMAGPPKGMERPNPADFEKLSTPERIDKMRALRDQRRNAMNEDMAKRDEATKTFYNSLNADQKKVFDSETFRMMSAHHGRGGQAGGRRDPS